MLLISIILIMSMMLNLEIYKHYHNQTKQTDILSLMEPTF
jgi:hypothetical protein